MNFLTLERLPKLGDAFCHDLARITVRHLKTVAPEDRGEVLAYLQDKTSLYSPYTNDLIEKELDK